MNYRVTIHFADIEADSPKEAAQQVHHLIYGPPEKTGDGLFMRITPERPEQEPGPGQDEITIFVDNNGQAD